LTVHSYLTFDKLRMFIQISAGNSFHELRYVTEMFPAQKKGMLSCLRRQIQGQVFNEIKTMFSVSFLDASGRTEYRQSFYTLKIKAVSASGRVH